MSASMDDVRAFAEKNENYGVLYRIHKAEQGVITAKAVLALTEVGERKRMDDDIAAYRSVKDELSNDQRVAIEVGSAWDIPAVRKMESDPAPCATFLGEKGPWFFVSGRYSVALDVAEHAWTCKPAGMSLETFRATELRDATRLLLKIAWKETDTPDKPKCTEDDCYHHRHYPNREPDCYYTFRPTSNSMCSVCYDCDAAIEKDYVEEYVEEFWDNALVCMDVYKPESDFKDAAAMAAYYFKHKR